MANETSAKTLSLEGKLPDGEKASAKVLDLNVAINIRNASTKAFTSAKLAIKDEDTETVKEATFGRINTNSTGTQNVRMPGGIESALYRIEVEGGDPLIGGGFANNAEEVNITVR